jgi:hypothetical protein
VADQVFELERHRPEPPDGHRRAVQRQRRDNRVDAAAVGKAGVAHGGNLVDPAADQADDAVDDLPQVGVVAEAHVRHLDPPAALDVNLVETVHQDVADAQVLQQRLERPETERLVHHLVHEAFLVVGVEQALLVLAQLADDLADLLSDGLGGEHLEVLEVQPLDELLVDADFELLEVDVAVGAGDGGGGIMRGDRGPVRTRLGPARRARAAGGADDWAVEQRAGGRCGLGLGRGRRGHRREWGRGRGSRCDGRRTASREQTHGTP